MKSYDKNGRLIMVGDILKVYHFAAAIRRQHMYMYKQVIEENDSVLRVSHLNMNDEDWYTIYKHDEILPDYEIVQSIDALFDEREKISAPAD